MTKESAPTALVAWAGWQARMPADWRPLRLDATWGQGSVILGTAAEAAVQVRWWRPPHPGRFEPAAWVRRDAAASVEGATDDPPAPPGFAPWAWAGREGSGAEAGGGTWRGWSPAAGLALEVTVAAFAGAPVRREAGAVLLPSLRATAAGEPTVWALFEVSFETPAGFEIRDRRVHLGDIALRFVRRDGARLLLRQVYPAGLALNRRPLATWLEFPPFREARRFGPGSSAPVPAPVVGPAPAAVWRCGRKCLPFPLGWWRPLGSAGAVVQDPGLDRLLVAELDVRGEPDSGLVAGLLTAMNRGVSVGAPEPCAEPRPPAAHDAQHLRAGRGHGVPPDPRPA